MLKLKFFLFILVCGAFAQLHADDSLISQLTGSEASSASDFLDRAGQYPPPLYYYRYLAFSYKGVGVKMSYLKVDDRYNPLDIIADFNGKVFHFPTGFSSMDTFKEMRFKAADDAMGPAGIYLYQTGFRWNAISDMRDRVESRTRIADVHGALLAKLEYHEDSYQAQQAEFDEAYPQFGYNGYKYSLARQHSIASFSRRLMGNSIPEEPEGTFHHWEIERFYQKASDPQYDYNLDNFEFQKLKGWVGFGGIPYYGPIEMYASINDHLFTVPFPFQIIDNWSTFKLDSTGYYWIQRGFVIDSKTGAIQRGVATLRIASPDGAALSALEYNETLSPAEGADYMLIPESSPELHY